MLQAAFTHATTSIINGNYLEAVTVLESILTDRLGSLVYGSLGQRVTLRDTLGHLIKVASKNVVIPRDASAASERSARSELPGDLLDFLQTDLKRWWAERNHAIHGMAKLHTQGDLKFNDRYAKLQYVAIKGVGVLLQLDEFDRREKERNGAGRAATWPDAFHVDAMLRRKLTLDERDS